MEQTNKEHLNHHREEEKEEKQEEPQSKQRKDNNGKEKHKQKQLATTKQDNISHDEKNENTNTTNMNHNSRKMRTKPKFFTSYFWYTILVVFPIGFALIMNLEILVDDLPPPDYGSGSMFDRIASRYDTINRVLALRMDISWRQLMVNTVKERLLELEQQQQQQQQQQQSKRDPSWNIVDFATGTGDVAIALANTIPTAQIHGIDPSNGMLFIGRDKVDKANVGDRVKLLWGDARDPYMLEDHAYDAATMAFGIRNVVPNRNDALCQIHRVLKPGGIFCILEFSEPDESFGWLGNIARTFIRYVVPIIGGLLSGAPTEYLHLQNSIKDFPSPKEFVQLLESIQCRTAKDHPDVQEEEHHHQPRGAFVVDNLIQLNFGSVQLYVTTAV